MEYRGCVIAIVLACLTASAARADDPPLLAFAAPGPQSIPAFIDHFPLSNRGSPFVAAAPMETLPDAALGYAGYTPTTGSFAHGPTNLPAESGVNMTLSSASGYVHGNGLGTQAIGGVDGTIAVPIGHPFGLISNFAAVSIGGQGLYQGGSALYWRDPGLGLVGLGGQIGHSASFGGYNFGRTALNLEGYFGRFTPFAVIGTSSVRSPFGSSTVGTANAGIAYYPINNLQLTVSGYDYGSHVAGARASVEYLLPQRFAGTAATVGLTGSAGSNGSSSIVARFKVLFGTGQPNNKTLIERRRQDDPFSFELYDDPYLLESERKRASSFEALVNALAGGNGTTVPRTCTDGQAISSGCTCPSTGFVVGNPPVCSL